MKTEMCLVICFLVGVLVFYLLKQSCGCKVVEGQITTNILDAAGSMTDAVVQGAEGEIQNVLETVEDVSQDGEESNDPPCPDNLGCSVCLGNHITNPGLLADFAMAIGNREFDIVDTYNSLSQEFKDAWQRCYGGVAPQQVVAAGPSPPSPPGPSPPGPSPPTPPPGPPPSSGPKCCV